MARFFARTGSSTIIATVVFAVPSPVYAQGYVDPGAGAMLWQILTASLLGGVFVFRKFVLSWFRSLKTPRSGGDSRRNSHSDK